MPVKSCLLFLYQMILFEFGPMNPKNLAAENSKKCQRYGNSIQYNIAPCCMKSRVNFFPPIQTLLHIYTTGGGGNCIDIDVEQMAGVVKNSTLKTQNDTLLDSVYFSSKGFLITTKIVNFALLVNNIIISSARFLKFETTIISIK